MSYTLALPLNSRSQYQFTGAKCETAEVSDSLSGGRLIGQICCYGSLVTKLFKQVQCLKKLIKCFVLLHCFNDILMTRAIATNDSGITGPNAIGVQSLHIITIRVTEIFKVPKSLQLLFKEAVNTYTGWVFLIILCLCDDSVQQYSICRAAVIQLFLGFVSYFYQWFESTRREDVRTLFTTIQAQPHIPVYTSTAHLASHRPRLDFRSHLCHPLRLSQYDPASIAMDVNRPQLQRTFLV